MLRLGATKPGEWRFAWRWIFQWPEWWRMRDYNWVNFYPIRCGIEAGKHTGFYAEFELAVLGVGFVAEVYHAPSREAFASVMHDRMEEHEVAETVTVFEECEACDGMGNLFVEREKSEL